MGGYNDIVVIFDFDKTIIECDSDNWVVDGLGGTDRFNELVAMMPWNSMMDEMMKELHQQGKSVDDISQVLKTIPIHPRVVPAIKAARALGCELRIVSDANAFFIDTVLENLGIAECFSEIHTNPSFQQDRRLRITPLHDPRAFPQLGCNTLCPPNMCKGVVLERIKAGLAAEKRIIYLGDGVGDYCPSLKLDASDFVMPRNNFPVWDLISQNPSLVKAQIHGWTHGGDLETILLTLINAVSAQQILDHHTKHIPTLPQPIIVNNALALVK